MPVVLCVVLSFRLPSELLEQGGPPFHPFPGWPHWRQGLGVKGCRCGGGVFSRRRGPRGISWLPRVFSLDYLLLVCDHLTSQLCRLCPPERLKGRPGSGCGCPGYDGIVLSEPCPAHPPTLSCLLGVWFYFFFSLNNQACLLEQFSIYRNFIKITKRVPRCLSLPTVSLITTISDLSVEQALS